MIEEIASITAPMTGYLHTSIIKSLDAKETPESKKAEEERAMQETKEVQRISQISDAKGKIIGQRWREIPMVYNAKGEPIDPRYGEGINLKG